MKTAVSILRDARISLKDSITLCRTINGKRLSAARTTVERLVEGKEKLNGKFYTKAAKKILEIIRTVENNAKVKGMDEKKLFIKKAKADKGYVMRRPRSRWRARGQKAKSASITIEVGKR